MPLGQKNSVCKIGTLFGKRFNANLRLPTGQVDCTPCAAPDGPLAGESLLQRPSTEAVNSGTAIMTVVDRIHGFCDSY